MAKHTCDQCPASFTKMSDLLKHRRTQGHNFTCNVCNKSFQQQKNLNRHIIRHVDLNQYTCEHCGKVFSRSDSLRRHVQTIHLGIKRKFDGMGDIAPAPKRFRENDVKSHYDLQKIKETFSRKFNTMGTSYKVTFKDIEVQELKEIMKALKRILTSLLEDITNFAEDQDVLRLSVQAPDLDYPIEIPFRTKKDITVEALLSEIERVLQSYEEFVLDNGLEIDVIHVRMPKGAGRKKCDYVDLEKTLKEKRCIIQIQNKDNLCCARAIVTAIARLEKHEKWNSIRQSYEPQGQLARELHEKAGLPLEKCGIEEIKQFQAVLPEYQIAVWSGKEIIFTGPKTGKKIYLYHHNEHYDVITSIPAFLARKYYCEKCQKGYDHKEEHKCNNPCHRCKRIHEEVGEWINCNDCNRYFNGEVCYDLHKKLSVNGNSTCRQFYRCSCGSEINRSLHKNKNAHRCGNKYCKTCKDFFLPGHQCYMLPERNEKPESGNLEEKLCKDETKDEKEIVKYVFFDFETTQQDVVQCERGYDPDGDVCKNCKKKSCGSVEHRPNLCIAQRVCELCLDEPVTPDSECENCGKHEHIFAGRNTRDDFCKWLFSKENKGLIVLAHNFRGFDSWPILSFLHENNVKPKVIPNGAKNMAIYVEECNIKMIDSLNFLPVPLSKLPKMFGIKELVKGHFPHLFNREENQNVVLDHLPDIKYYNPDGMKSDDRDNFLKWYDLNRDNSFDFKEEILKYCRSDVDILRRCCLAFRDLFLEISRSDDQEGIDPFQTCITIASACQKVFRRLFLKNDSIGVIPTHGYKPEENQSKKALKWIKYQAHSNNITIQHARNGGEVKVGEYRLDGYYETLSEKICLEFHGCFWHGCPKCYARDTKNPVNGLTMGELYDLTLDKENFLKSNGFTVVTKWECEFTRELESNPTMKAFIDKLEIVSSLQPRDAFFGGRTEAFTLYKERTNDEAIHYYDVTSLYPYINKTGKYVTGHPRIITENFENLENYEGLVKCKILPPRGLLLPVLPCKMNKKLLFALCKTCAESQQQDECHHTDEDRAFIGTWVTDEVKKAIEKGYEIQQIYEVWHFNRVEQYEPKTKTGGLFTGYVNKFLKIKQEASGWPQWCVTEEDKQKYVDDYKAVEGIKLDYSEIKKNPGLRSLAKLMLNSFWGKFGQRSNLQQVEYVSELAAFYEKLTSDAQEVTHINFVNEETVEMRWSYVDDFVEPSNKTNVVIAAYTTAQARLKLYSYLEKLGSRALYADTDSVIFSTSSGEEELPLGDYLGDLTDEVPDGAITHFVTGGPKNYAYKVATGDHIETVCKVRGITLNYKNALAINFDSVKDMVLGEGADKISVTDSFKIVRDRKNCRLLTQSQSKDYKIVYDKRVIMSNYCTLPYGY